MRSGFEFFPMRLLDRYIVRNFLQPFVYCIFGFLSIWLIYDISDNSSTIFDGSVSFFSVVQFYWTQIPQVMVILLPVALLLALLFALGRMSRSNEIVSMLTAGVSVPRLVLPLLFIGLLTTGVTLAFNYSLAAHAELARKNFFDEVKRGGPRDVVINGQVFRNRTDNRTWYIARFRPNTNEFSGVQIVQQDRAGKYRSELHRDRGLLRTGHEKLATGEGESGRLRRRQETSRMKNWSGPSRFPAGAKPPIA